MQSKQVVPNVESFAKNGSGKRNTISAHKERGKGQGTICETCLLICLFIYLFIYLMPSNYLSLDSSYSCRKGYPLKYIFTSNPGEDLNIY